MLKVQLAPAATLAGQLLASAKSPLAVTLEMTKAALPVLVNVTACAGLVFQAPGRRTSTYSSRRVTTGTADPVPDKLFESLR